MIDLKDIGPVPPQYSVEYWAELSSETGCDEGFAGGYSSQSTQRRAHRLSWPFVNRSAVSAFLRVLSDTADGNVRVMFTPPMPSMKTVLGRLVGPFNVHHQGAVSASISGTLVEDF